MDLQNVELDEETKSAIAQQFSEQLEAKLNEETAGLKAKVDELLGEKKRVQQEREEARLQAKAEAEEKAKRENDYKQLFEAQKQESDTLRSTIEKMNANLQKTQISAEAGKIASQLTKDTQRAELLSEKISQRLTIVDGELRVTDESGQLTVSSPEELANTIRSKYQFLVDGTQASGGGAARSDGRAEERPKEISRSEFDALSHNQRAEFFKSGGSVFDD
jgi:hypothetical protein